MDGEQPVAAVQVAVDPVGIGGLIAHLLRDGGTGRTAVCGAAGEESFVPVELDWSRLPAARRCLRCDAESGVATAC